MEVVGASSEDFVLVIGKVKPLAGGILGQDNRLPRQPTGKECQWQVTTITGFSRPEKGSCRSRA